MRPPTPAPTVDPNSLSFLRDAMIAPTGFREYDVRWRYPQDINLPGITALGLGIGTQLHAHCDGPATIAVGNDYRSYSLSIKNALILGLMQAGVAVHDIGPALSPMTYFSQIHLGTSAMAMVTASHNPNGWTGVKLGFGAPLTHGPDEMAALRDTVMQGQGVHRPGGSYRFVDGVRTAYLDDLVGDFRLSRPLRVVCATGNGTAGAFAPDMLRRIGAEVVERHCDLDDSFPHYNPNPEALEMLHDMADCVRTSGADLALGFDGDGDRCGVVDETGEEIFADKIGVMIARDLAPSHAGATLVCDVKSTGLFAADPVLQAHGISVDYWKTGHSHMKRRVKELGALAGFEKSGHHIFASPLGHGYDCGLRTALEVCKLLDRNPDQSLSDLHAALPKTWITPTLSPYAADTEKYGIVARLTERLQAMASRGERLAGQRITEVVTVNGARVTLENGGWGLLRASSNTPNLVVVCESPNSEAEMRAIFAAMDAVIRVEPGVGAYDQTI